MILAIHDRDTTLSGVTYPINGVFVEVSAGTTLAQAQALYAAHQASEVAASTLAQIAALEQAQLMPRVTREFLLLFMEANGGTAVPGYAPLKAFDETIKALRAQL